jgi:hypothetical protein
VSAPGTISRATIRQRVAEAIARELSSEGWQESPVPVEQFGTAEGDNLLHKSYAVGCPSWRFLSARQKETEGTPCETMVRVRWAYNLAALDQVTSYDEGLVFGERVQRSSRRILGVLAAVLESGEEPTDDQGWMMGDYQLRVTHLFSLT